MILESRHLLLQFFENPLEFLSSIYCHLLSLVYFREFYQNHGTVMTKRLEKIHFKITRDPD
jgi:hypothetical protein